ncbi:MAG: cysteine hydrolase [Planctomycetota bacterium]
MTSIDPAHTAVLLIGFQNDYFADDGILHGVIEANAEQTGVLGHTVDLLKSLEGTDALFINLPILFSSDYHELENPAGLLALVKEVGAFRRNTEGGAVSPEIMAFGDRILHLEGKTGFNAFLGTDLESTLRERGIERVILTGVVTSVCIDSTGRAASEKGFSVTVVSDCSAGRNSTEHDFYCENVFPLYAEVASLADLASPKSEKRAA